MKFKKKIDPLFQLIQTLTKAEKRHFKLFSSTYKRGGEAKFIILFDTMEGMNDYNEDLILKKNPQLLPRQLSNLKSFLYKQILLSLRTIKARKGIELEIKDLIESAKLLFDRCLYKQSKKLINRAHALAKEHEKHYLMSEIMYFERQLIEKLIESGMDWMTLRIIKNDDIHIAQLSKLSTLHNLSLSLYAKYMQEGFVKDEKDFQEVERFFLDTVSTLNMEEMDNTQRYYYYACWVRYYFFVQQSKKALIFAYKNNSQFLKKVKMQRAYPEFYIKSYNHLLTALYRVVERKTFFQTFEQYKLIEKEENLLYTEHLQQLYFKYKLTHECNYYFLQGEFHKGALEIPHQAQKLSLYEKNISERHLCIFYYKFACMLFGAGEYKKSVVWLNKIINTNEDGVRNDIQCFARILILICHFELQHEDLVEYYVRSTYRFLIKKHDLYRFQRLIMDFLRETKSIDIDKLLPSFVGLKEKMIAIKRIPFENRVFQYFDIISWLESKIEKQPVEIIIRRKFELLYN